MKRKLLALALAGLLVIAAAGCSNGAGQAEEVEETEIHSNDFESGTQSVTLQNLTYSVPESWEAKDGAGGFTYYYPASGDSYLMVSFNEMDMGNYSITDQEVFDAYISGMEGDEYKNTNNEIKQNKNGITYAYHTGELNNESDVYDLDAALFDCEGGVVQIGFVSKKDCGIDYTQDINSIFDSVEVSEMASESEKPLSSDEFVQAVREVVDGDIGEGESVVDVRLDGDDLIVSIDMSGTNIPDNLTATDVAESRFSSITDDILGIEGCDDLWEIITVDFGDVGYITGAKADVLDSEYGRYFRDEVVKIQKKEPEPEPTPTPAPAETVTTGQRNALSRAKEYLRIMAFSYSGLIDQLKFEGFSTEEATYGADNCGADWNEQAAKKAQEYLDIMSFSRQGLIDQLKFEGFTQAQAEYGASAVGY